jgi:hypothetical protein
MQNKSRCYVLSFISSHRDKKFKIQRGVELALDKKVIQFFFKTLFRKHLNFVDCREQTL